MRIDAIGVVVDGGIAHAFGFMRTEVGAVIRPVDPTDNGNSFKVCIDFGLCAFNGSIGIK